MTNLLQRLLRSKRIAQYSSSPEARRTARYRILKRYAERNGFPIYKSNVIWTQDEDFVTAREKAAGVTGISDDRCFVLLDLARKTRAIGGDIAECGVRFGRSAIFMLTGSGADTEKSLFLFDSFEGLSAPTAEDRVGHGEAYWKRGDILAPVEILQRNLRDFRNIRVMKGWIPARFAEVADCIFSLVHIDVDLYQPTLDSLAFFHPRMAKGGFIVCDDYGLDTCPGAKRAFDEFFADKPQTIMHLPTGQCVVPM